MLGTADECGRDESSCSSANEGSSAREIHRGSMRLMVVVDDDDDNMGISEREASLFNQVLALNLWLTERRGPRKGLLGRPKPLKEKSDASRGLFQGC